MDALQRLSETYRSAPQMGLVLGAGVSVRSGVPDYPTLATRVLELAEEGRELDRSAHDHHALVAGRVARCETPPPDEILGYARAHIASRDTFHELVREALYRDVAVPSNRPQEQDKPVKERSWKKHKMVASKVYTTNPTLDAVISFCAAEPGGDHARPSAPRARAATNRHVGAILTTNYDNLVEASFGTKYRTSLVRPVGRFPIKVEPGRLPVYHCHGYVTYPEPDEGESPYSPLLIAEEDYYEASFSRESFGNTVIAQVLGQMPCLFIGSAMTDRNLRRHLLLSRMAGAPEGAAPPGEHFAILPDGGYLDGFTDDVLARYGVAAIRVHRFAEIPELLHRLYVSADDAAEDDWQWTQMSFAERDAVRRDHRRG